MIIMLIKMTAIMLVFVAGTALVWKYMYQRQMTLAYKLLIGIFYGLFAILSTHYGVDHGKMMLNLRDLGPLCAGLFFDPLSGIIAGLIGGIERYIAGTWYGIGSYTRIACSISTCLAGFIAALTKIYIFKNKKPSGGFAFFLGAVMEVFHMYVVFITHSDDMTMAFYVVRTGAPPMIFFSGLGLALSSIAVSVLSGEYKNPFRKKRREDISISQTFQFRLFTVTFLVLTINLLISYAMQTQTSIQNAREVLEHLSEDIRMTYDRIKETDENTNVLSLDMTRMNAEAIAEAVNHAGKISEVDDSFLDEMRKKLTLLAVTALDMEGNPLASAGSSPVYTEHLEDLISGKSSSMSYMETLTLVVGNAICQDGIIQVVFDGNFLISTLNIYGLTDAMSYFHIGNDGSYYIIENSGIIILGDHTDYTFSPEEMELIMKHSDNSPFRGHFFNSESLCRVDRLDENLLLLQQLPMSEIYAYRNAQVYQTTFGAIVLFAVLYILVFRLVEATVVRNLNLVNASLNHITHGNLNEQVTVRSSSEFATLSDDINKTVTALKGYIEAAKKRMEEELELARTIQEAALPKNFDFQRKDFEIYATMDPAKAVGGDFYDFFIAGSNKLGLVIADVSGKGIPAALFMMRAKTAIRGMAVSGQDPADILFSANNILCEGNDADMFVTAWLGIIDLSTGKIKCSNAGHEYPVIMRSGCDYEYVNDQHSLPLAVMEGMMFKDYELDLLSGDRLFIYTDGVPEALNEQTEQYGSERFLKILNSLKDSSLRDILPAVRKDIADFADGAEQFDDITMLAFNYYGPEANKDS